MSSAVEKFPSSDGEPEPCTGNGEEVEDVLNGEFHNG